VAGLVRTALEGQRVLLVASATEVPPNFITRMEGGRERAESVLSMACLQ
jgi:hypothetical protein